jgi:hypothetical protein
VYNVHSRKKIAEEKNNCYVVIYKYQRISWENRVSGCEGGKGRYYSARILEQYMGAGNRLGIVLSYQPARAGIFKQSMGARNRVGIGLSYRPARLHRLAEFIP